MNTANVNVFFRRALQQSDQPQLTSDGTGLTGADGADRHATPRHGDRAACIQRPTGDDRRSTLNTNDLRGKILRIKVKDGDITAADANKADFGTRHRRVHDPGREPVPARQRRSRRPKTRPEVHSMGFRNPFRIQVDENDVAYITDYSPDANTPARSRGPVGRRPLRDRAQAVQLRLSDLLLEQARLLQAGTSTSSLPGTDHGRHPGRHRRRRSTAARRRSSTTRAGTSTAARATSPACARSRRSTDPEIWYSYNDNRAVNPLGTPCFGYYATTPGPIAPGSTTECPRLFPELYTGGVGRARHRQVQLRPGQPEPEEVPGLLRRVGDPGRVHAGHAARAQARLAEPRVQDQQRAGLRRLRRHRRSRSSATPRWTCSSGPTARSTC